MADVRLVDVRLHVLRFVVGDFLRVVVHGLRRAACPVESSCPRLHVVLALGLPCPSASDGSPGIDTSAVRLLPVVHELADPFHPSSGGLVSARQHAERRVVTVYFADALCLLHEERVDVLSVSQLHAVVRPAGSLRLDVESRHVGCEERSLWRAVGVEPHVVESISFACLEHVHPLIHAHRRIACEGEVAVLHGSAQLGLPSVDEEHPSFDFKLAHSEHRLEGIALLEQADELVGLEVELVLEQRLCALVGCVHNGGVEAVEVGVELIPELHVLSEVEVRLDGFSFVFLL